MEEAVGAVNHFIHRWMAQPAVWKLAVLGLISAATASAQTLQLNSRDILASGGLGQKQPAVSAPAAVAQPVVPPPAVAPVIPDKVQHGYLYVEPYQARFEALVDATRILHWLNPMKDVPAVLDAAAQKALTEAASRQTQGWCLLTAGNRPLTGNFLGASVIKGKPGATLPLEAGAEIVASEAMIGFIWEFPTPPAPDQLTVEWLGFVEDIKSLPIRVFFGPKSEMLEVSTDLSKATWKSQGRLPMPAPLAAVPEITVAAPIVLHLASVIWGIAGFIFYAFIRIRQHHLPGGSLPFFFAWVFGAMLSWPLLNINVAVSADVPPVTDKAAAEKILTPLLRNVYRAFDHRAESEIYDVLALSVDGELLRKLYLETIQALTLEGREGTRVTISEFSADVMSVQPTTKHDSGFISECQWTALGSVGHWGHSHTRVNRYTAKLTVIPVDSAWKIVNLDVSEARRL
jgi:hypothetical protein